MKLSESNILECVVCLILIGVNHSAVDAKGFDRLGNAKDDKLRLCFVEARGTYKKANKFCPILAEKSNIECVVGLDRMDCLRRIHKGTAHFGVFSSEDLITAEWADVDVLITSEMRFNDNPFEYQVVAVVANDAGINSVNDLRDSRFCHPGHGLTSHWTDVLANYFESSLVARGCEDDLSMTESRIKASANFFGPSCKAGPWVSDPLQDAILKQRYPSLCEICYNPASCSKADKHWGRVGPLFCLTSGKGDVAWTRLDDVKGHFNFSGSDPTLYSFLCLDGHLQPLNTTNPCVWVAQPWPAVAAKRDKAEQIQQILATLSHDNDDSWQNALLNLLETYHVTIKALDTSIPINDFLDQAVGFASAYSFPSCNPPRGIVYCTASLIEHFKCSWLQEAATAYGIEPSIQCIRADSLDQCMDETSHKAAEIVLVDEKDRVRAERQYGLRPLLYEYARNLQDRYTVVAVVHSDAEIYSFKDLRGKRACFPSYEGGAYLSALETIRTQSEHQQQQQHHLTSQDLTDYFAHDSCTWESNARGKCNEIYYGDEGALRCLAENRGQVAFVDMHVFKQFAAYALNSSSTWTQHIDPKALKLICPFGRNTKSNDLCYVHWTSRGQLMVNNQMSLMRKNETYNAFRDMDRLFGKNYISHIIPFSMFGRFDRRENVLFHDQTEGLRGIVEMRRDRMARLLEDTYTAYSKNPIYRPPSALNSASAVQVAASCSLVLSIVVFHYSIRCRL